MPTHGDMMKNNNNEKTQPSKDTTMVRDAVGNLVPCQHYQRIISLVPSITETLFDFVVGSRVIGVTRYCIHPPEAQQPPRTVVGGSKSPKITLIKNLKPDLVIINKEEQKLQHAEELQAFTTVFVTYPRTVTEAITMLEQLACLLMLTDEPHIMSIISETTRVVQNITNITNAMDTAEKPRVFCPIWKNPWMTINADTFIHDMITIAGGINIFHDKPDRYPTISLDEIKNRTPDLILLPDEPYHFTETEARELKALFNNNTTTNTNNNETTSQMMPRPHVTFIPGSYLSWYGTRTRIGLQTLHDIISTYRHQTRL